VRVDDRDGLPHLLAYGTHRRRHVRRRTLITAPSCLPIESADGGTAQQHDEFPVKHILM
jgi:hypothetical protein